MQERTGVAKENCEARGAAGEGEPSKGRREPMRRLARVAQDSSLSVT